MTSLLALARLTRDDGASARGWDGAAAREAAAASGGMAERARGAGDLLARWVALAGRPGDDLDPDSAEGAAALAVREELETELRWLEAHAARTAAEAEAKLAVALALAALSGGADARHAAFLARAQAETAGLARGPAARASLLPGRGLFGAVGLRR